jgi:hypothetical protein
LIRQEGLDPVTKRGRVAEEAEEVDQLGRPNVVKETLYVEEEKGGR